MKNFISVFLIVMLSLSTCSFISATDGVIHFNNFEAWKYDMEYTVTYDNGVIISDFESKLFGRDWKPIVQKIESIASLTMKAKGWFGGYVQHNIKVDNPSSLFWRTGHTAQFSSDANTLPPYYVLSYQDVNGTVYTCSEKGLPNVASITYDIWECN